jgi:hypothetical protein
MDLSMDGTQSDMLYINNGTSDEQTLQIKTWPSWTAKCSPATQFVSPW